MTLVYDIHTRCSGIGLHVQQMVMRITCITHNWVIVPTSRPAPTPAKSAQCHNILIMNQKVIESKCGDSNSLTYLMVEIVSKSSHRDPVNRVFDQTPRLRQ